MSERTMVIPAPVARPGQAVEVHNYRIKNRFVFEPGKCIGAKYTLVDGGFVTFGKWSYDVLLDRRNPSGDYMRLCVGDSGIRSICNEHSGTVGEVEISVVNLMPADEIEKMRALLTYRKDIEGPGLDSVSPAQALALIAAWDAESEENIRLCGLYDGYKSRAERAESELARARAAGIEAMRRAEQADAVICPICGAHGHIGDCEED